MNNSKTNIVKLCTKILDIYKYVLSTKKYRNLETKQFANSVKSININNQANWNHTIQKIWQQIKSSKEPLDICTKIKASSANKEFLTWGPWCTMHSEPVQTGVIHIPVVRIYIQLNIGEELFRRRFHREEL